MPADIIDKSIYDGLYVKRWKRFELPDNKDPQGAHVDGLRKTAFLPSGIDKLRVGQSSSVNERREKRLKKWANDVRKAHQLLAYANDLVERADPNFCQSPSSSAPSARKRGDVGSTYSWAYATVKISSDEAIAEIDRLQADSKLFRSLAVAFLFISAVNIANIFRDPLPATILMLALGSLIVISLYRYAYLRWKATQWLY